jgi:predicted 3-demethylubiquinone-9 3-methyltransferase (glyoxalase superfamily)
VLYQAPIAAAVEGKVINGWDKSTTDGGEESMCGWLKDKYGLSWQIIPKQLSELTGGPDPEKSQQVCKPC